MRPFSPLQFTLSSKHLRRTSKFGNATHYVLSIRLRTHNLLPCLQSAYRKHHSTDTAVLKVLGDILLAVDSGYLSVLALLDLSAAFDAVDHDILLLRLVFGLDGVVCSWFRSYLTGRVQRVRRGSSVSASVVLQYGVRRISAWSVTFHTVHCRPDLFN